ncbi:MAG: DUF7344 domain-containing protein [Halorubrum sp.]
MPGYEPTATETDRALNALSHSCRRRLLFKLYEEVNCGDRESITRVGIDPFETERKRVRLHHSHLPKLEEYGYVRWSEAEETIRTGPRWEEIEPLLELIYAHLYDLSPSLRGRSTGSNRTEI